MSANNSLREKKPTQIKCIGVIKKKSEPQHPNEKLNQLNETEKG
jgi:hypothetical protein